MTAIPLCANPKCQRPMPNWGVINLQCPLLCRKCFKADEPARPQPQVSVQLNQQLLELIDTKADRLKSIACLAIQFSIPKADAEGIFSDPAGLLKEACKTLGLGYDCNLIQSTKRLLNKSGLWLPHGKQLRGKGTRKNKMKLGEKIRPFQAPQ